MPIPHIHIPRAPLAEFCQRHHIQRLALFGSVLRDDFRPDSDVDVLVEFETGHVPGFDFAGMEIELTALVGRKVDLRTARDFSAKSREQIAATSVVQYVAE
jgi:predicted nucleotidyltransferase